MDARIYVKIKGRKMTVKTSLVFLPKYKTMTWNFYNDNNHAILNMRFDKTPFQNDIEKPRMKRSKLYSCIPNRVTILLAPDLTRF